MGFAWIIVFVLVVLLIGYIWGRRLGIEEGIKLGRALAPLELRQQSQEKGYCLLCTEPKKAMEVYHPPSYML